MKKYSLSKKAARRASAMLAVLATLAVCGGLCSCRSKGLSPDAAPQSVAPDRPEEIPWTENSTAASLDAAMRHTVPGARQGADASDAGTSQDSAPNNSTPSDSAEKSGAAGAADSSARSAASAPSSDSSAPVDAAGSSSENSAANRAPSDTESAAAAMATPAAGTVTVDPAADWPLTLVNGTHLLGEDYAPPLQTVSGSEKQLETHAAAALEALLAAAAQDGCPCHVVSGYRSVRYQQGLFARKVQSYLDQGLSQTEAEEAAAQWVARPGASEHSLGLAVDLVSGDWYLTHDDLTEDFADTPQFAWLQQHAAAYGFILRYPKDKEAVTGVHYEPWHYRYVGEAAADIAASGLTLEEYLQRAAGLPEAGGE